VPPVTASSAAANRRADSEAPAYRIIHASRIASSISGSVTFMVTGEMFLKAPAYSGGDQGASRKIGGEHARKVSRERWRCCAKKGIAHPRTCDCSGCHQFADGGGGNTEIPGHPCRAEARPDGARIMLALAGGTSNSGAALRMVLAVTGRVCSITGAKVERQQRRNSSVSPPIIGDVRDHALLEGNLLNLARHVAQVHQVAVDLGHPGFWSIMLGSVHSGSKAERGFRVSAMACALAPPVTSFLPRQPSAG
jgi:hypothetical protein